MQQNSLSLSVRYMFIDAIIHIRSFDDRSSIVRASVRSFIHFFFHSFFIHPSIYSFVQSFFHSFILLFVRSFVHLSFNATSNNIVPALISQVVK